MANSSPLHRTRDLTLSSHSTCPYSRAVGHAVGESLVFLCFALAVLGAIHPDNRWSRAFVRGPYWAWVIPRGAVRAILAVAAALLALVAFVFR